MGTLYSFAIGIGTKNSKGEWLEVFYPKPLLEPEAELSSLICTTLKCSKGDIELGADHIARLRTVFESNGFHALAELVISVSHSSKPVIAVLLDSNSAPASVPQAFLKLHLLSHRLVKPHETRLDGIFGTLKNVAWTNQGAIDLDELPQRQLATRLSGDHLSVDCVDKFPKMVDYVVPRGVRIADTARVRLGAYVGEGTTVMHEGFINFNAGTAGPNMIEGRISAGVFCGAGSDIGGGASTMGTLSGGGNIVISLGEKCLLGANAGVGIPLGDRCTIESGLYITAGTVVTMLDDHHQPVAKLKARELSGKNDLLFRRNSLTGAVECLTNKSAVELNEILHTTN